MSEIFVFPHKFQANNNQKRESKHSEHHRSKNMHSFYIAFNERNFLQLFGTGNKASKNYITWNPFFPSFIQLQLRKIQKPAVKPMLLLRRKSPRIEAKPNEAEGLMPPPPLASVMHSTKILTTNLAKISKKKDFDVTFKTIKKVSISKNPFQFVTFLLPPAIKTFWEKRKEFFKPRHKRILEQIWDSKMEHCKRIFASKVGNRTKIWGKHKRQKSGWKGKNGRHWIYNKNNA